MMDYFYKLVLKTLLLIGGIERNPGPKQGPPPLGIKNNLEQSKQLEEPNVLQILQQIQGKSAQIQGNFQKSINEVKQTVQQLQEDHTKTQQFLQQLQQSQEGKQTVQQLQEDHTTTQQSLQQLQQSFQQLQQSQEVKQTVQQLQEDHTTTQQSLQQLQQSLQQLQQSLQQLQQSLEQGQHTSHKALQIRGLKELVAQYKGYEKDDIWRKIVELLERSLDPSCVVYQQLEDIKNDDPSHIGNLYDHLELLELLLDHKLNVNKVVNIFMSTLLHFAAHKGHVPVVRLLLQRGADIDKTNIKRYTPLHYSASNGHLTVCQLLVEAGCDPGVKNNKGKTALDMARNYGRTAVVKYLSSVGD